MALVKLCEAAARNQGRELPQHGVLAKQWEKAMSKGQAAWKRAWKVEEDDFGGGAQGTTKLVSRIGEPQTQGVMKLLKHQKSMKARLRMHREVTILRTLANQGLKVPRVLAGNTDENDNPDAELYFVMERVPGRTLDREIRDRGPLRLEEAVAMTLDLCRTVACLHHERVLHRDLKPTNIMVRSFDKADLVILDYGLSFNETENEDDSLTDTDEAIGNRFYRSHELTLPGDDKHNARSDIAPLVAIFYYCLTSHSPRQPLDGHGKPPHRREGCSVREALQGHPRVKEVEAILDRGFAPDMDSRFHAAEELAERLKALLRPPGLGGERDLAQVSRDAAAKLRQHNRAARLAELGTRLQPLRQQLAGLVAETLQSLDPIFEPAMCGSPDLRMPPGIDTLKVAGLAISLGVRGTVITRNVVFLFAAQREEGVLLRVIFGPTSKEAAIDGSRPCQPVHWFDLQDLPGAEELLPAVHAGLVSAIDELEEEAGRG
jgi:hypothetical protein